MAGPFPLLTDEHISKALVSALRERGWDVARAVDLFGQRTDDEALFERAAREGRVFVTADGPAEAIAIRWLREWRTFRGLIIWSQGHQKKMSVGELLDELDALAAADASFAYPIHHIKPRR